MNINRDGIKYGRMKKGFIWNHPFFTNSIIDTDGIAFKGSSSIISDFRTLT